MGFHREFVDVFVLAIHDVPVSWERADNLPASFLSIIWLRSYLSQRTKKIFNIQKHQQTSSLLYENFG